MLRLWWTNLARAHCYIFQPTSLSRIVQLQTRNLPTIKTCSDPRISTEYASYYKICNPNLHYVDHQHSSLKSKISPERETKRTRRDTTKTIPTRIVAHLQSTACNLSPRYLSGPQRGFWYESRVRVCLCCDCHLELAGVQIR